MKLGPRRFFCDSYFNGVKKGLARQNGGFPFSSIFSLFFSFLFGACVARRRPTLHFLLLDTGALIIFTTAIRSSFTHISTVSLGLPSYVPRTLSASLPVLSNPVRRCIQSCNYRVRTKVPSDFYAALKSLNSHVPLKFINMPAKG